MTKTLPGVSFDEAVSRTTAALKTSGFGVLTTIDIADTMKQKLGTKFDRPYVILGACNPSFAHRALMRSPGIGLLLPCNVVVTMSGDGESNSHDNAVVSMLDPVVMFTSIITDEPGIEDMAKEVKGLLEKALDEL